MACCEKYKPYIFEISALYFKIYALYFLQKSVSDFQQLTKAVKCGFPHLFFRLFRQSLSLSETDCGVRCCTLLILFLYETAEKRTFAFGLPNKAMDEHSHSGKKPQIAVVNRNTLAANGLTSLIEGVMPMAEVAVFNKMSDIPESSLSGLFHFFISADVLFENREYFVGAMPQDDCCNRGRPPSDHSRMFPNARRHAQQPCVATRVPENGTNGAWRRKKVARRNEAERQHDCQVARTDPERG